MRWNIVTPPRLKPQICGKQTQFSSSTCIYWLNSSKSSHILCFSWLMCLLLISFSLPCCLSQEVSQVSIQCISLPGSTTGDTILATANCNASSTSVSLGFGTSAPGFTAAAFGYETTASVFAATAIGQSSNANGLLSIAYGYDTIAGGATSLAGGSGSQTFSDADVPGGSSAGGAVSIGDTCKSSGDWSLSFGSHSEASGYASGAIGCGAISNTWGEIALGLYPEEANLTTEEKRNQSVIPTFREQDVVLRVGNGCEKLSEVGGIGCETERRSDALRVYKSGKLYLKKLDGTVVEDVAAEIMKLQEEVAELRIISIALMVLIVICLIGLVALTIAFFGAQKQLLKKYAVMS